jgi:hypothetical protein
MYLDEDVDVVARMIHGQIRQQVISEELETNPIEGTMNSMERAQNLQNPNIKRFAEIQAVEMSPPPSSQHRKRPRTELVSKTTPRTASHLYRPFKPESGDHSNAEWENSVERRHLQAPLRTTGGFPSTLYRRR